MLQFPRQVRFLNEEQIPFIRDGIDDYSQWLSETTIPMLQFKVTPGFINGEHNYRWFNENVKNGTQKTLTGRGYHFVQETHSEQIGAGLKDWLKQHFVD